MVGITLTQILGVLCRRLMIFSITAVPFVISGGQALAASTVTVAITSDFVSRDPYGDSTAQMFGIWCQVYGCLATYDPSTGTLKGMLAERWFQDPNDRVCDAGSLCPPHQVAL